MVNVDPPEDLACPSSKPSTSATANGDSCASPQSADEHGAIDDEHQSRLCKLTWDSIDLDKLVSVALSLHGAAGDITLGKALHGAWNLVQPLIFDDGTIWIARIPKLRRTQLPRDEEEQRYVERQIAVEVAALRYVPARTDIPVPEVYYWTTDRHGDGVGLPFTLEEFLPGVLLKDMWDNLSDDARSAFYKQLAHMYLELSNKCRLPLVGSPHMIAPNSTECTTQAGDDSEFILGKVFFAGARNEVDHVGRPMKPFGGPYHNALECLHHETTLCLEDIRTDHFGSHHNIEEYAIRWTLRSLLPHIYNANHAMMDAFGFVLCTGDFNVHNILVDIKTTGLPVITGILDWDFAHSVPNTEFTEFPFFLQSNPTWERDDPRYERINADQAVFLAHLRAEEETINSSTPLTNAIGNSRLSQLVRTAIFNTVPITEEEIWDRIYGEDNGQDIALDMREALKEGVLKEMRLEFEKDGEVRRKILAVLEDAGVFLTPMIQSADDYLELIGDRADLAEERCYLHKVILSQSG